MTDEDSFNDSEYFDFNQDQDHQSDDDFLVGEIVPARIRADSNQHYENVREREVPDLSYTERECFFSPGETWFFSPEETCFFSPEETRFLSPYNNSHSRINNGSVYLKGTLRKSLSMSNLPTMNSLEPKNLDQTSNEIISPQPDSHCFSYDQTSESASKEHINRLAQPKHYNSHDDFIKPCSMTLAEAVNMIQASTPKTFKSKSSFKMNKIVTKSWSRTIPHTPKLMTRNRNRPVTALSTVERETKEMEGAKKFRIKANPINRRILNGPLLKPQVDKKPATVVQPFRLTEVKKKHNNAQPTTKGQGSNFSKRSIHPGHKDGSSSKRYKPTCTQPVPFSFEKRDQEMLKKKEELIRRILEAERTAREFRAKPLPKSILKSQDKISKSGLSKLQRSTHSRT